MKNFLEALEKEIHAAQEKKGIQAVAVGSRIMTYSNASVASNTGQGQPGATLKIRKTKLKEIIHTSPIKIETPEVPVVTQVTAVAQAAEQNDFDQKASVHRHPLKSPSKKPDIKSLKSHNAIVDKMKKREAERRERRADAESRRKEREAALQAQKEAEEKARIEGEESERKKFLEQKKEERRLAQQVDIAEQEKERQRTRRIQLHQKAAMHNCKRIMKAIGWMPWKVFVACHRQDIVLASEFRQKWDLLSKLLQWRKKLARKRTEVEMIAIHFYQSKLLRKAWTSLREKKVALGERLANAIHFSRESQKKCFQKVWYQKTKESIFYRYQLERERELAADALAAKLAPRRFLRKWHAITSEQKEGRWREWRRNQLRSRIKEMLTTSTFEEKLKREYTPHRKLNSAFNVDDEEMP
ncbi:hypothetical protein BC830DRAFT_1087275 [Chytriomyces sp. MP71]|nr:hypothetical protein BC830DRAFT_1087275 [Chytriomyces sp. MP71]